MEERSTTLSQAVTAFRTDRIFVKRCFGVHCAGRCRPLLGPSARLRMYAACSRASVDGALHS